MMGQVRWVGWTMAIATALVAGGQVVWADIASDKPAAIVVFPKIRVDESGGAGVDTVIRLTNTNLSAPIAAHCFFIDANSHCSGGTNDGAICTDDPTVCTGLSFCVPSWIETDFNIQLTPGQPIEWKVSEGLADGTTCNNGTNKGQSCDPHNTSACPGGECVGGLPLPFGVCQRNPLRSCGSDADCNPFPGGPCTQSNAGTRIPPVPEDPFVGELKCIAVDANGVPAQVPPRNDLKGVALIEKSTASSFDVASYNALGIEATGASDGVAGQLVLGGDNPEFNGCPNFLILNHFFDDARDPVPGTTDSITTDLTLVPCTEDLLRQIPGVAIAQFLVFNEFEQRFSTSHTVRCFEEIQLCNIDTPSCTRSIFNVNVAGTLTGQTRINAVSGPGLSGLLGVAIESHDGQSAAFNLHMQGARDAADIITIP